MQGRFNVGGGGAVAPQTCSPTSSVAVMRLAAYQIF
jgi:hypothetical protein